jgi:hypothetical protein
MNFISCKKNEIISLPFDRERRERREAGKNPQNEMNYKKI